MISGFTGWCGEGTTISIGCLSIDFGVIATATFTDETGSLGIVTPPSP